MADEYFRSLRQGQVVVLEGLTVADGAYVIVSQSCDLVQEKREMIQLAPIVEISDQALQRGALNQENPRYPAVCRREKPTFADLGKIVSLEKELVVGSDLGEGIDPSEDVDSRNFGLAVARWFGRFAFPNDVQPWLAPLQKLIREKYDRPSSALGRVLHHVSEIRVEAASPTPNTLEGRASSSDWARRPLKLILHVVVDAGTLPTVDDDDMEDFSRYLASPPKSLDSACEALLESKDRVERLALWHAVTDFLAERCRVRGHASGDRGVNEAVQSIEPQLWSDDEFPSSKYRKSEQLDVDFLSDPTP